MISAIQRGEAAGDAAVRPGDEVHLVGELPESLAGYDETWLRKCLFVVRYVGRDATVDLQPDLIAGYFIATVPIVNVTPARR